MKLITNYYYSNDIWLSYARNERHCVGVTLHVSLRLVSSLRRARARAWIPNAFASVSAPLASPSRDPLRSVPRRAAPHLPTYIETLAQLWAIWSNWYANRVLVIMRNLHSLHTRTTYQSTKIVTIGKVGRNYFDSNWSTWVILIVYC